MDAIIEVITNLFSDVDLGGIMDTVAGYLAKYDISEVIDTITSFFGGLVG